MAVREGGVGGFQVCTGVEPPEWWENEERAEQLEAAVEGLRQIRRLANVGVSEPAALPAEWERRQPLRVVSLLLEAGRIVPAAVDRSGAVTRTGYRTSLAADGGEGGGRGEGGVRVEWAGPRGSGARYEEHEQLGCCASVLRPWGFDALMVKGPGHRWHLEVEPRPRGC